MLDIGWSELLVIGVVALIVVGPKDLPVMFKTLGRFTARARGMAREFQRAMDQAANDSGIKDVANDLKSSTSQASAGINALKDAADKFEKWDPRRPVSSAAKAAVSAATAAPAAAAAPPDAAPAPATPEEPKAQS
ncbi:Sec-independent protein translocase protein TatB [Gemmobacter nectariphilus]|uniref:Sec-independent protein translocase protein TatB n=1 Tax=Gemmobacter nectariphilus TaxID=220343 RepID=UPI0003FC3F65|nr:Sec-independent protein translocase protein TatB [Gemmobacter nectariphilus]